MLVLGIDPGIGTTGFGLVSEQSDGGLELAAYGVITTPANESIAARLQQIYREIRALIEKHQPASAAVEKLLFGRNVSTAMSVGQARGVIIMALADAGLEIGEYTPATVKEAVAGYGNASKDQVQDMVRNLLRLEAIPRPDDAADALAVAITHLHSIHYQHLLDE